MKNHLLHKPQRRNDKIEINKINFSSTETAFCKQATSTSNGKQESIQQIDRPENSRTQIKRPASIQTKKKAFFNLAPLNLNLFSPSNFDWAIQFFVK